MGVHLCLLESQIDLAQDVRDWLRLT